MLLAVRAAVKEARDANRMTLEHDVRALLAERLADAVDRAAASSDVRWLQAASRDLLDLLDTLPIRVREGGEGDRGSARGKLLSILDGPPAMGD